MTKRPKTSNSTPHKERGFWASLIRDRYLWFMVCWVALVVLLGVFVFAKPWNYFCGFVAAVSVASTVLPIPTNPIVITVAKFFPPILVALFATCGMVLANLMDYQVFSKLARTRAIKRLRKAHIYRSWVKLFTKIPFLAISIAAFVPIPVDFIRLLAILEGYPRLPFSIAGFLGRFPRNLLLAVAGLVIPLWAVIPAALVLVAPAVIYAALDTQRQKRREEALARGEEVQLDEGQNTLAEMLEEMEE